MAKALSRDHQKTSSGTVAYVLKSFPRISEIFIASEIYRLEQAGVQLQLYVLKPPKDEPHHEVVDLIQAKPEYLPAATSLSRTPLHRWLARNLHVFLPSLKHCFAHHPIGFFRAAWVSFAQAIRSYFWSYRPTVYLKEFLDATVLADRLLRTPDVRHLHAHFCHWPASVTWLASIITGIPFSFTAHAKDIYYQGHNPAGLLGRKMDAAQFVVTCTEVNRLHLQKLSKTRVHCIYHGVNSDLSRLLQEEAAARLKNGCLRALSVGRLVRKKGFDVLVEACGILKRRGVALEAVIVGKSGEHETEIKRRIAKHNLENCVRLVGPISQKALFEEYLRATAFCLACRVLEDGDRDGIPNVLTEAMACGLPVVSTAVSGIPEIIINNVNGLLVPPEDPEALADALLRLNCNPVLAQQLSLEGRRVVQERFDGEKCIRQLAELFRELTQA